MKTKYRFGFGHMDMSRSVFPEYVKGDMEFHEFDPEHCRTGTHYAIANSLGGDKIPINKEFDYSKIDTDLIFLWLQGGAPNNSHALECLKHMRNTFSGVIIINWEEVYWFTDAFCQQVIRSYYESTRYVDAVSCGWKNFDKRMKGLGFGDITWKYNVIPYDVKWFKYHFGNTQKIEPHRIYSVAHGRATRCDRTAMIMNALKNYGLTNVINRYRFIEENALRKKTRERTSIKDLDFINIIDTIDPSDAYMKYLGESYLFIDEYPAYSASHTTIDAACVGTPTVSHIFNSSSEVCFPKTTVHGIDDFDSWINLTKRLIKDDEFYHEVRNYAFAAVEHYSIETFLYQLDQIHEELRH